MGKHRHGLLALQQSEERADAGRSQHEVEKAAGEASVEPRHYHYHRHSQHTGKLA